MNESHAEFFAVRSEPDAADFETLRKLAHNATLHQSLESVDMAHLLASHNTANRHRRTNTMTRRAAEIAQGHEWTNSCNAKVVYAVASGFMTMRYVKDDPARLTIEQTSLLSSEMRDRALREMNPPAWGYNELRRERVPPDEPVLVCDHPDGTVAPLQPGLLQRWTELKYINMEGDVAIETPNCVLLGRELKRDQYYMVVSLSSPAIQVLASILNWGHRNRDGHLGADYDCTSVSVLHQVHSWLEIMGMSNLAKTYFINASARALEAELRRAKAKSKAQIVTSGPGVAEVFQILFKYGYGVRNWDNPMDAFYHAIPLSTIDKEDPAFYSIALLLKARAVQLENRLATPLQQVSFPARPAKRVQAWPEQRRYLKRPRAEDQFDQSADDAEEDLVIRPVRKKKKQEPTVRYLKRSTASTPSSSLGRSSKNFGNDAPAATRSGDGFPSLAFRSEGWYRDPTLSPGKKRPLFSRTSPPMESSQNTLRSSQSQQYSTATEFPPDSAEWTLSPSPEFTRALDLQRREEDSSLLRESSLSIEQYPDTQEVSAPKAAPPPLDEGPPPLPPRGLRRKANE